MNRLLNITKMSDLTRRKIRAYAGVKRDSQLPALLDGNLTISQSLAEFGARYNNEILKKREEKHRKAQANYLENKKFKTLIETRNEFDFTFKNVDQFTKLIQNMPNDKKFLLNINDKKYTLNAKTKKRLLDILMDESGQTKSDDDIFKVIESGSNNINFKKLEEPQGYALNEGGFFKYTSILPIDLTDLQIMTVFDARLVEDNCFIKSLKMSGITPEKVPAICSMVIGRDIPQRMLKEIAEKFEIYITVLKELNGTKTKVKTVEYGAKGNPHLPLGLLEEHYFLIKEMPFTSYAIKNYDTLKEKKNWNEFIKKDERNKKRFINSYDLIKLMFECKYFKPLEMSSELLKTVYNDKIKTITTIEEVNEKNSRPNMYEEKKTNDFINVMFDFETTTEGDNHKPYMVCVYNDKLDKTFYGADCGKQMLYFLSRLGKNIRLIAHNAGYDIRFLFPYITHFSMINRSKFLLRGYGKFYFGFQKYFKLEIQDSYAIISSPLRDFGKMFQLDVKKEIMPYHLYTQENVNKKYIKIDTIEYDQKHEFLQNCKEWGCYDEKTELIDIIKYSAIYCRLDCIVLYEGYNKFKNWIMNVCGLNIDYYVSSASIAHDYMLKEDVYDGCYSLSGLAREFIQQAMVGGRTMISENKPKHIKNNVDDFDAVSLYPSAMKRLGEIGGYLKGTPKIITDLTYDFLKNQDGYFVEILIKKVNKHYKFPLMSKMGDVREFTNDMEGETLIVDKITLEDLIHYQEIKFEIVKGYYYNEGRNNKILEVITHLFETRKREKANKNPVEQVFKLIMNSAYGKSLLKPFDTDSKYVKDIEQHATKYYKHIKEIIPLHNGTYKVDHYKSICEHFNNCQIGIEVLSMSKRIMNEVMCLAEDNNLNMYYQDTDSIHIDSVSVPVLADQFKMKYNRELIGKEMGQFHTDFSSNTLNGDLVSIESIYLGKKCYIDKLSTVNPDKSGGFGIDYHIRMKGVPTQSIQYYARENNLTVFQVYEKLFKKEKITFDLACGGEKCCFDFRPDMTIKSLKKFERDIQFK